MKALIGWLVGLMGLAVPTILSVSGSLPGVGGDTEPEPLVSLSALNVIDARLTLAQEKLYQSQFPSPEDLSQAERFLREADTLSSSLPANVPTVRELLNIKTVLWDRHASLSRAQR